MSDIRFYHLSASPLEKALPALVEKIYGLGKRVLIHMNEATRVNMFDTLLWTFKQQSFLPHGTSDEPKPELQPILLSTSTENLNQAEVYIGVDNNLPEDLNAYPIICYIFDEKRPESLEAARTTWRNLKQNASLTLSYWQQSAEGNWQKQS